MVIALVLAATGVSYAAAETGVIGPSNGIQPSGRLLDPVGKMTQLGNFPTGGALTNNGRFLWTLSAGRGANCLREGCRAALKFLDNFSRHLHVSDVWLISRVSRQGYRQSDCTNQLQKW